MSEDIRWIQRFDNFQRSTKQMENIFEIMDRRPLSELERQGLIKAFEYNYELAWNVVKDFYEYQGVAGIMGSRDAFRQAFKRGLVSDGKVWMDMVEDRIKTIHTYHEEVAGEVLQHIIDHYFSALVGLRNTLLEWLKNHE